MTLKYYHNVIKKDSLLFLKHRVRSITYNCFKNKGYKNNTKTEKLLGIKFPKLKIHLERQFTKGMTWSNYGKWHIDHIIPLASANTEEELIKLCHYRNLQPLWAKDNLIKGAKIPNVQIQFKL